MECYFEPGAGIDEKYGLIDVVFLDELGEKDRDNTFVPRRNNLTWRNSFVSGSTAYS